MVFPDFFFLTLSTYSLQRFTQLKAWNLQFRDCKPDISWLAFCVFYSLAVARETQVLSRNPS